MDNILFIPYFLESHMLPTLGMAKALKEKYNIMYALPARFKWFPELHGYEYKNLEAVPFGYGFEMVIRKAEGSTSLHADALADRRRSRIARHREKKLKELIESVQPKFIFLDLLSTTDFILLYQFLDPSVTSIAFHTPMLSTYTRKGVPRPGSSLEPGSGIRIWWDKFLFGAMSRIFNWKEAIAYAGYSNKAMVRKEFRGKKIPGKFGLIGENQFAILFKNIPEFITAPEELEFFMGKAGRDQYYIGPLLDSNRAERMVPPDFERLITDIRGWKKDIQKKIILCAFGSMHSRWDGIIIHFLEQLFTFISSQPSLVLVCAFDDKRNLIRKESLGKNIILLERVPQLELLHHADLFITHAGLGSLKESIFCGVPMLAYPFTRDWDSTSNAAKVLYHKLGLRGNILKDKSRDIGDKISYILSTPLYKQNVLQMQAVADRKYTGEHFQSLLEKIMQQPL